MPQPGRSRRNMNRTIYGVDPTAPRTGRGMVEEGFRPAAISSMRAADGKGLTVASVWHRSLVPDEKREDLAKRQANAAVAALERRQARWVWPLLRHRPDPRLRSTSLTASRPTVCLPPSSAQAARRTTSLRRRALMLALGGIQARPRTDAKGKQCWPRSSIGSATTRTPVCIRQQSGLMRRCGLGADGDRITRGGSTATPDASRGWFVNKQGSTFAVIKGPVEFFMERPATSRGRARYMTWHRQRIDRSYAIATRTTLAEYHRMLRTARPATTTLTLTGR